jgi:hypothetical protein
VITLGTGLGSALFVDGRLMPNLETGHHPFKKNKTCEMWLGKAAMAELGKKKMNAAVGETIVALERLFNLRKRYIGGGNAKKLTDDLPATVQMGGFRTKVAFPENRLGEGPIERETRNGARGREWREQVATDYARRPTLPRLQPGCCSGQNTSMSPIWRSQAPHESPFSRRIEFGHGSDMVLPIQQPVNHDNWPPRWAGKGD